MEASTAPYPDFTPQVNGYTGRLHVVPADRTIHHTMVNEWREGHGQFAVHWSNLPTVATLATLDDEYAAYVGAFLDRSTPLAWLEWVTTRPGLSLTEARAATSAAIGALEHTLAKNGIEKVFAFVTQPLFRDATHLGYQRVAKDTIPVIKSLTSAA